MRKPFVAGLAALIVLPVIGTRAQNPDAGFIGRFTGPAQIRHYAPDGSITPVHAIDHIDLRLAKGGLVTGKLHKASCSVTGLSYKPNGAGLHVIGLDLQFDGCASAPWLNGRHHARLQRNATGARFEISSAFHGVGKVKAVKTVAANLTHQPQ